MNDADFGPRHQSAIRSGMNTDNLVENQPSQKSAAAHDLRAEEGGFG